MKDLWVYHGEVTRRDGLTDREDHRQGEVDESESSLGLKSIGRKKEEKVRKKLRSCIGVMGG